MAHISVLQCVAVYCSALQCVAVRYRIFQCVADVFRKSVTNCLDFLSETRKDNASYVSTSYCNTMQHTATHCCTLPHTATHCHTLPHCRTLQHTATHCHTLQHAARHCNTLQPKDNAFCRSWPPTLLVDCMYAFVCKRYTHTNTNICISVCNGSIRLR